jgi:hypothetical protein
MNQGYNFQQRRKKYGSCRLGAVLRRGLIGLLLSLGWAETALAEPEPEPLVEPALESLAEPVPERRAAIGIDLFRTTLAADRDIADKGDAGGLPLLLVYTDDPVTAELLGEKLLRGGPIREQPIRVEVIAAVASLSLFEQRPPAGIFLTQPTPVGRLQELVAFAKAHGIILFSPFQGEVELGATAGQYVGAQVQPYINLRTLEESGIELKVLFFKIAKIYR